LIYLNVLLIPGKKFLGVEFFIFLFVVCLGRKVGLLFVRSDLRASHGPTPNRKKTESLVTHAVTVSNI